MKLKSLIFMCCISLCSSPFAANQHLHPQANKPSDNKLAKKALMLPGSCEIEIINNSFEDVRVFGVFDDGSGLEPFNVYSYESPHYISLFYYGYCHAGMDLFVDSSNGYHVYSGYTRRNSTVRLVPYLANQLKAEVRTR